MVTRKEVAKLAGVSAMTVTRVVTKNGYVSKDAKERVERAIKELNYIPNKLASSLVQKNSKSIAVILHELSNPYYTQLVESMIERARQTGFSVLLFQVQEDDLEVVIQEVVSNRVSGILNMLFQKFSHTLLDQLQAYEIRSIHAGATNIKASFNIAYNGAIEQAIKTLKKSGKTNPVFVLGTMFENDVRVMAFKKYCKQYGMRLEDGCILMGEYPKIKSYITGYEIMKRFLREDKKCDSVFCLNDMMAVGAMKAVQESGLIVPDDVAVVGFDNIAICKFLNPPLSSIGADIKMQAKYYTDFLTGRTDELNAELEAKFHVRGSIKA